jgi:hypothetical protein
MCIFSMCVVDCWKMYSQLTFKLDESHKLIAGETQNPFYGHLAAEMIDNNKEEDKHGLLVHNLLLLLLLLIERQGYRCQVLVLT